MRRRQRTVRWSFSPGGGEGKSNKSQLLTPPEAARVSTVHMLAKDGPTAKCQAEFWVPSPANFPAWLPGCALQNFWLLTRSDCTQRHP